MNIVWLYNRLKLMPFGEILYRIKNSVTYIWESTQLKRGWQPYPPEGVNCSAPLNIINSKVLANINHNASESLSNTIAEGNIHFFDYPNLKIGFPIHWHRDPLTGVECPPNHYGKTIDYRDSKIVGDSKVVWELGRHQFLVPIATAYFKTKKPQHLERISTVLSGWLTHNPFGYGVHWCNSLEIALRSMSWCLCHEILLASGHSQGLLSLPVNHTELKNQIYQHAYFIRNYLSKYSSANNHLIGELAGLHMITQTFDMGKIGDQWRDFAWSALQKEMTLQVYADGVNKEQAIHYHAEVFEYFLLNLAYAKKNNMKVSNEFTEKLDRMYRFMVDLSPGKKSNPPKIGDADDGTMVSFPNEPKSFFETLIDSYNSTPQAEENRLKSQKEILYQAILNGLSITKDQPYQTAYPAIYNKGGYAILGDKNFHIVFDAGALGYPEIAAHGHADALSFNLAINGFWWIVDPGTYAYHTEARWRDYFRGSRAHNVLVANGKDQSDICGAFMWSKQANAQLITHDHKAGCIQKIEGTHTGYSGIGANNVRRCLEIDATTKSIVITDTLNASKALDIDIYFHFHPMVSVNKINHNKIAMTRIETEETFEITVNPASNVQLYSGDSTLPQGWYSERLGHKTPTISAKFETGKMTGENKWVTTISPINFSLN